jgi:hypothetical protein
MTSVTGISVAGGVDVGGVSVTQRATSLWEKVGAQVSPKNISCGIAALGQSDLLNLNVNDTFVAQAASTFNGITNVTNDFTTKRISDVTADGEVRVAKRVRVIAEASENMLHLDAVGNQQIIVDENAHIDLEYGDAEGTCVYLHNASGARHIRVDMSNGSVSGALDVQGNLVIRSEQTGQTTFYYDGTSYSFGANIRGNNSSRSCGTASIPWGNVHAITTNTENITGPNAEIVCNKNFKSSTDLKTLGTFDDNWNTVFAYTGTFDTFDSTSTTINSLKTIKPNSSGLALGVSGIPWGNVHTLKINSDAIEPASFSVNNSGDSVDQVITAGGSFSPQKIIFVTKQFDDVNAFNDSFSEWNPQLLGKYLINVTVTTLANTKDKKLYYIDLWRDDHVPPSLVLPYFYRRIAFSSARESNNILTLTGSCLIDISSISNNRFYLYVDSNTDSNFSIDKRSAYTYWSAHRLPVKN